MAGEFAEANPAIGVSQVISQFPIVYKEHLCQWGGVCYIEGGEAAMIEVDVRGSSCPIPVDKTNLSGFEGSELDG